MSPLQNLCNHSFHENLIYPQGSVTTLLVGSGEGYVDARVCYLIVGPFQTKWLSQKFSLNVFGEGACGSGVVDARRSLLIASVLWVVVSTMVCFSIHSLNYCE